MKKWEIRSLGGSGSGNYGHAGRPGKRGGSLPKSGGSVQGPSELDWAKGVRAVKDLGGQVPAKAVKNADKVLQKAGLAPTTRKAPKTYKDIGKFYEKTRPVPSDIWKTKGIVIEVGNIVRSGVGGSAINIHTRTDKGGRESTVYTDKDWSVE